MTSKRNNSASELIIIVFPFHNNFKLEYAKRNEMVLGGGGSTLSFAIRPHNITILNNKIWNLVKFVLAMIYQIYFAVSL